MLLIFLRYEGYHFLDVFFLINILKLINLRLVQQSVRLSQFFRKVTNLSTTSFPLHYLWYCHLLLYPIPPQSLITKKAQQNLSSTVLFLFVILYLANHFVKIIFLSNQRKSSLGHEWCQYAPNQNGILAL